MDNYFFRTIKIIFYPAIAAVSNGIIYGNVARKNLKEFNMDNRGIAIKKCWFFFQLM